MPTTVCRDFRRRGRVGEPTGVATSGGGVTAYGADPNKPVTDDPAAATQPSGEAFTTLRTPAAGDVYRASASRPAHSGQTCVPPTQVCRTGISLRRVGSE